MEEKGRRITIKADISELQRKFREANKIARDSAKEMRAFNNSLRFDNQNFSLLTGKLKEFKTQIEASTTKVKNLREQIALNGRLGLVEQVEKLNKLLVREESHLKQLKKGFSELDSEVKRISFIKEFDKLDKQLVSSRNNLKKFEEALKIDPKNINAISFKLIEMGKVLTTLESKGKLFKKELSTINPKINSDAFRRLTAGLLQVETEAKKVRENMSLVAKEKFSSLTTNLGRVNKELEETNVNVKNLTTAMKGIGANSGLASSKFRELQRASDLTKEKIRLLKRELKNIDPKINVSEFARLNAEISESQRHLKSLKLEMNQVNASGLSQGFTSVSNSVGNFGSRLSDFGRKYALTYSLPVAYANKKLVDNFAETDDSIRSVAAAASDGIASNFKKAYSDVYDSARKTSEGSIYSMNEVARGSEALIKAGWNLKDSQEQVTHVMNLAKVEGMELASATTIVTDGLSAFGMRAGETERFVDALNMASIKSTTGITEMGETLKYVGSIAGVLGFTVEDTSVAIALMANKGIKASQAGTTLRSGLSNLVKPSAKAKEALKKIGFSLEDNNGKTKSLAQVISELREKTKNMTESQKVFFASTVFGKTAMSGWTAILNSSDESVKELTESIKTGTHTTKEMANQLSDGIGGALTRFKVSVSNTSAVVGKNIEPMLTGLIDGARGLVEWFGRLSPTIQGVTFWLVGFSSALPILSWGIGNVLSSFGNLGKGISNAIKWFKDTEKISSFASKGVDMFSSAIGFLSSPIGLATGGLGALTLGLLYYHNNLSEAAVSHKKFLDNMKGFSVKMEDVSNRVVAFNDGIRQSSGYFSNLYGSSDVASSKFQELANSIGVTQQRIDEIVQAHSDNRTAWTDAEINEYQNLVNSINNMTDEQARLTEQRLNTTNNAIAGFVKANGINMELFKGMTQDFVKTLDEEREKGFISNKNWFARELALNEQKPVNERKTTKELSEEFERRNSIIDSKYSEGVNKLIDNVTKHANLGEEFFKNMTKMNQELQDEEQRHSEVMGRLEDLKYTNFTAYKSLTMAEEEKYKVNKERIQGALKELTEKISLDDLAMWLSLIQHQFDHGGKLTKEQATFVKDFVATMDTLPDDVKQKYEEAMKKAHININDWKPHIEKDMKELGASSTDELAAGIKSEESKAIDNTKSIMDNAKGIVDNTNFEPSGKKAALGIGQGVNNSQPDTLSRVQSLMDSAYNTANSKDFSGVGIGITNGIASGISRGWSWLTTTVGTLASSLLQSAKSALGINSPSRKFRDLIGIFIPEGIAVGINKTKNKAVKSIKALSTTMLNSFKVPDFSDAISGSFDNNINMDYQAVSYTHLTCRRRG